MVSGVTDNGNSKNGSGANVVSSSSVERRCENADCNVVKLVSMVSKRKNIQFVTEPSVMDKPLLINGFTTVFQVDGSSAKLSDLKNPNPTGIQQPKTVFRIIPNTHAHIVNYVVVDADGDSLRKINENDPATMRKLLESQKVSADQMLKKLIAGHGTHAPNATTAPASATTTTTATTSTAPVTLTRAATIAPANTRANSTSTGYTVHSTAQQQQPSQQQQQPQQKTQQQQQPQQKIQQQQPAQQQPQQKLQQKPQPKLQPKQTLQPQSQQQLPLQQTQQQPQQQEQQQQPPQQPPPAQTQTQPPTTIQLPMRMHPNLKITAVASADLVGAATKVTAALPVTPQTTSSVPPPVMDSVENPVFDKMQAEIRELRRTVALLAEAQAKTAQHRQLTPQRQQSSSSATDSYRRPIKRARHN